MAASAGSCFRSSHAVAIWYSKPGQYRFVGSCISAVRDVQHEQVRADLREGRIGLAQNRLPASAVIEDARPEDVVDTRAWSADCPVRGNRSPALPQSQAELAEVGLTSLRKGEVAVVTLAAGAGSRWTQGAGVVKALHPFCRLGGQHRTFIETHLAKSSRTSRQFGMPLPHVITTSYLTHGPTEEFLARQKNYSYEGPLLLSPGRSVGWRMIPTVRDLRFLWEEMPQQILDEQQQKVRDSLRHALIHWAELAGEASDYTDNLPLQCLHPVGHWFEVPNLRKAIGEAVGEMCLHPAPAMKDFLDRVLGRSRLSRVGMSAGLSVAASRSAA